MNSKIRSISSILLFMGFFFGNSQVTDFTFTPASGSCNNNIVNFSGSASNTTVANSFTFDGGSLPLGWVSSPYAISSTFCPGKNSPDNSNYFWATNLETTGPNTGLRYVQTNSTNVALGGTISFYLRYAADEAPSAGCEDPDQPSEEVILQYSLNGGTSWVTIYDQWDTIGDFSLPWYNWYAVSLPIPIAAQSTSTIFRWYQPSNSGAGFDNWGLDSINITATSPISVSSFSWNFGDSTTASTENVTKTYPLPAPGTSATYSVTLTTVFSNATTDSKTKTYVVNSSPNAPTADAQSVCPNATVANLTATGSNIKWYNVPTGGAALLSTATITPGNYYASQTVSGCESPRVTVAVMFVNVTQTISAGGPTTFCVPGSVTLTAPNAPVTDLSFLTVYIGTAGTNQWQSFIPTKAGLTTALRIYINGAQNLTTTLNIYSGTGTTGSLLSTQSVVINSGGGILSIPISPINLTVGSMYTFQLTGPFLGLVANNGNYGSYFSNSYGLNPSWRLDFETVVTPFLRNVQWYNGAAAISGATNLTYVASTSGSYSYTAEVGPLNCPSTSNTVVVNSNPVPNAVATPTSQTACSGVAITTIVNSGSVAGTVYNWTRNNSASVTGIATSGIGNISGTLTNTTASPVTVTFTITPSYTNAGVTCTGTAINATLLINPMPDVNQPTNQVLCNNSATAAINFIGAVSGTTFNWTNNTPSIGLAASGTGDIASFTATNSTNAPLIANVSVTPSTAGVSSTTTIVYTGAIQDFTVPAGVSSITISVSGAQGGDANAGALIIGGKGAKMSGDFAVVSGEILKILVGQKPNIIAGGGNGGGGGSFVWKNTGNVLLAAAGGGGGSVSYGNQPPAGQNGVITTGGTAGTFNSNGSSVAPGGTSGNGGGALWEGSGGAGWLANGTNGTGNCSVTTGGQRPLAGGNGGTGTAQNGGFGGGGGGGNCWYSSGGGGGYSGGAGSGGNEGCGGGGGSYNAGTNQVNLAGSQTGNGIVTITYSAGIACTGTSKTFNIIVNPTPTAVATPASQTACSGVAITTIVNSGAVTGTVYNWSRNNTTSVTGIATSGVGDITGTLTNTTATPVLVTFTITPSYTNAGVTCTGTPITATILVNGAISISCPVTTTTTACQTQGSINTAFATWLATASANGGSGGVLTNDNTGAPSSCGGTTTVTFTYTNTCAPLTSTCQASYTVQSAPTVVINAPVNTTTTSCQTQAAVNTAFTSWLATASASGNCNGVLTNNNTGAPSACGGATTVTFTYTGTCAPLTTTAQATFTVPASATVIVTAPVNTTATSCQTQSAVNTAFATWLATAAASGNCNGVLTNNSTSAPSACGGATTVTFTYTGTCAPLTTTAQATFTVPASATVILTAPVNTTATSCQTQSAVNTAFTTWLATAAASGNCNGVLTNNNTGAPSACGGATTVTFTYTGTCAPLTTTAQATFTIPTITVAITCPTPVSVCGSANVPAANTTSVTGVTGCNAVVTFIGDVSAPSATTPYTVTRTYRVTDSCGNFVQCTQIITVNPIPTAPAVAANQTFCAGGTIADLAVSGSNIKWYTSFTNGLLLASTTPLLDNTNYFASQTNTQGCESTRSQVNVRVSNMTHSAVTTAVLCNGGNTGSATISVANGVTPYSYLWSNGQINAMATGLISGTYSYTITDAIGCTRNGSVIVNQPTLLSISTTTLPNYNYNVAYTTNLVASGATPSYTFAITSGSLPAGFTLSATGILSGTSLTIPMSTFIVTVTDANGCTSTRTYTLKINTIAITVTADAIQKVYGTADPILTYTVVPALQPGTNFTGGLVRVVGENVGTYAISQNTLSAGALYVITYIGANFTIIKANQTITFNQTLAIGCDGTKSVTMTATASSGLPVSFASSNTAVITVINSTATLVTYGTANIIASQAGNSNYNAAPNVLNPILISQPGLIRKHFADVLFFDNTSNQFVSYKWFKNGVEVIGQTQQYYQDTAVLNGTYFAKAIKANGIEITTCSLNFSPPTEANYIKIIPNPVVSGSAYELQTNIALSNLAGAQLQVFDITGNLIETKSVNAASTNLNAPLASGVYILRLQLTNGEVQTCNLLVK